MPLAGYQASKLLEAGSLGLNMTSAMAGFATSQEHPDSGTPQRHLLTALYGALSSRRQLLAEAGAALDPAARYANATKLVQGTLNSLSLGVSIPNVALGASEGIFLAVTAQLRANISARALEAGPAARDVEPSNASSIAPGSVYVRLPEGLQLPPQCSPDNSSCMEPAALFQVSVFGDPSLFQGVLANDLVAPSDGSNAAFTSAVVNVSIANYAAGEAQPLSCAAGSASCRAQLLLPLGSASAAPPTASLACVQLLPSANGASLTSAQALHPATAASVGGSSYANCAVPHLGLFALVAYAPASRNPGGAASADAPAGDAGDTQGSSTGAGGSQGSASSAQPPSSGQASDTNTIITAIPGTLSTSAPGAFSGSGPASASDYDSASASGAATGTGSNSSAELLPGLLDPGSASISADATNSSAPPNNSTSDKQGSDDVGFIEELTAVASGLRPGEILLVVIVVVVAAALIASRTYMAVKNRAARGAAPPPGFNGGGYSAGGAAAMAASTATTSDGASAAVAYMVAGQGQQLAGTGLPQSTSALPRVGASAAPATHPLSPRGLRWENLRAAARLDDASDVQI
jgi:hypothetical protein